MLSALLFSPNLITVTLYGETAVILQKLQNRAARILTFSNYNADAEPLLERLAWKRLADRRKSHMATMVLPSEYLEAKFVNRSSITDYIILRSTCNELTRCSKTPHKLSKKKFPIQ